MLFAIIIGLLCLLFLFVALISMWRPRNFPPGPLGLPFFGSFHYIVPDISKGITKYSKIYGNIFSVKLRHRSFVCITGYDLIKEVMIDNPRPFSSRPGLLSQRLVRGANLEGIAAAQYGPKWAAHRKLFYKVIQNMGLSNKNFDKIIIEELPYFVDKMRHHQQENSLLDPSEVFDYAVLNVLSYFTFGNRYSYGDEKFKKLLHLNNQFFELVVRSATLSAFLMSFFPYLYKLWMPKNYRAVLKCSNNIEKFITTEVEYHKSTLDVKNPRDVIDYYLIEMSTQTSKYFSEIGLRKTLMDFFQAGTETTSTTLKWAVLYMVNNPEIQEKVCDEIDKVIGCDRFPTYEDKINMPYTEATILEVQRKATLTPVGLAHATIESTRLGKYTLPKGTCIWPSYHSVHFSTEYWKNPYQFDPENFLDPDGKVGMRPAFMPFGGGLRICLGINIAKKELFMFFATMLQHFKLLPPPGILKLDEDYVPGLTSHPKKYSIVMQNRI